MPRPSPTYNNQIDSKLPTNIKPLLYAFDEYQTYDLVGWAYLKARIALPNNFPQLTTNGVGGSQSVAGLNCVLFDRFTPDNHPWADGYSQKFYNLVANWSGNNLDRIPLPPPAVNPDYSQWDFPISYGILLPAIDGNVIITYLVQDDPDVSIIPNASPTIYSKTYKVINCSKDNNNNIIALDFSNALICSLVVSSASQAIKDAIIQQMPNGYLYSNLDALLSYINTLMSTATTGSTGNNTLNAEVITSVLYTKNTIANAVGANEFHSLDVYPNPLSNGLTITSTEKPAYYWAHTFRAANNNYWKNGAVLTDAGKIPLFDNSGNCFLIKPSSTKSDIFATFAETKEPALQFDVLADDNVDTFDYVGFGSDLVDPYGSYGNALGVAERTTTQHTTYRTRTTTQTFNYAYWSPYNGDNYIFFPSSVMPVTFTTNETTSHATVSSLVKTETWIPFINSGDFVTDREGGFWKVTGPPRLVSNLTIPPYPDGTPVMESINQMPSVALFLPGVGTYNWGWSGTIYKDENSYPWGSGTQITDAQMIELIDDVYYAVT